MCRRRYQSFKVTTSKSNTMGCSSSGPGGQDWPNRGKEGGELIPAAQWVIVHKQTQWDYSLCSKAQCDTRERESVCMCVQGFFHNTVDAMISSQTGRRDVDLIICMSSMWKQEWVRHLPSQLFSCINEECWQKNVDKCGWGRRSCKLELKLIKFKLSLLSLQWQAEN